MSASKGEHPKPQITTQRKGHIAQGYGLILTSRYTPEDLKDARTKIDYPDMTTGFFFT